LPEEEPDQDFEDLLEHIRDSRGFDFTGYKRPSLMRRVNKRMDAVGMESYAAYLDYLQVDPDEFKTLFDYILINVTGFFRDAQIWDYLIQDVGPALVESRKPDDPIRAWSAGCASGEEAYSVAMVLAEALGEDAFKERVKIYATDVDEAALTEARAATYTAKQTEPIPPDLRRKYFEEVPGGHSFRKDLRRSVIFGRHDLVQDAPISHIDLLVCRNTLMYLNAETQGRVMEHLHFALAEGGYLLLGKAELLFTHVRAFKPVDLKRRVFTKADGEDARERLMVMTQAGRNDADGQLSQHLQSREAAFDASPVAEVVVDRKGMLELANQRARDLFGLQANDLGRPFHDLELSFRPAELRSKLDEVAANRRTEMLHSVTWFSPSGERHELDIELTPLTEPDGALVGVAVTFHDTTSYSALRREVEQSNQELETAMEELQSTNEELETTNEELQSTNEELETMNEELQSTNQEIQTINEQLNERQSELDHVNVFLESILTSIRAAVVVLDTNRRVQVWNQRSEDLWGVRAEEALGQPFFGLDIGLPLEELRGLVQMCLAEQGGTHKATVAAVNRRGHSIECDVTGASLTGKDGAVEGAILMIEDRAASTSP
jgi:two-component system CheB/CheR fusion protein